MYLSHYLIPSYSLTSVACSLLIYMLSLFLSVLSLSLSLLSVIYLLFSLICHHTALLDFVGRNQPTATSQHRTRDAPELRTESSTSLTTTEIQIAYVIFYSFWTEC